MHALPPAAAELVFYGFCGHASFAGLCDAQNAVLVAHELTALHGKFNWHGNSVPAPFKASKGRS